MRLQQEGDHLQTKDSGLRRSQTCQHLDLDFQLRTVRKWNSVVWATQFLLVVLRWPCKLLHKHSQLGSCVSSQTVNKCPHGLFSHVFFTFSCALGYDFLLMISLFKISPKSSAKVLSEVPKHRKLWWCALWRKYKLDKLHPGVIYGAFGCEFDVNESALYIK